MRRLSLLAVPALVLSACGGGGDNTITNPPDNSPASLAIAAGDQQSAAAGEAVATAPSVLIKDHSGHPVSGIAVTFAVEAGGGSVGGASATTGSDGIARAGSWTLGSGANRLRATSGSLTPVFFTATGNGALTLTQGSIPSGGGTLTLTRPGHAADGMSITVPSGAYPGATSWSIQEDASVVVPLRTGFALAGPPLVVKNGSGYAKGPITLRMPLQVPLTTPLAPFYFDRATGTLEPIPILGRDANSATLVTRHFSASLMATRINASHVQRASAAVNANPLFGEVVVIWVTAFPGTLVGTFTSSFSPGVDDWEFFNLGEYLGPGGICAGMSFTEMFYHFFIKPATGFGLYHTFDHSLANLFDNLQGIRVAAAVHHDYGVVYEQGGSSLETMIDQAWMQNQLQLELWTEQWILLTLKLTGQPVHVSVYAPGAAHALTAYAATSDGNKTDVQVADPNNPGVGRTLTFDHGILLPFPASTNPSSASVQFDRAFALGVTADVPLSDIDARWTQFLSGSIAADLYPATYDFRVWNGWTGTYTQVQDRTLRIADPAFEPVLNCVSCPLHGNDPALPGRMRAATWDQAGAVPLNDGRSALMLTQGTTQLLLVGFPASPYGDSHYPEGFLDTKSVTVQYAPFTLSPQNPTAPAGTAIQFTAQHNGLAISGSTFTWTPSDGASSTTSANTFSHAFTSTGSQRVTVQLNDPDGYVVGVASTTVNVPAPGPVWRLTSIVNNGEGEITTGCSATTLGSIHAIRSRMTQLQGRASDGLIYTDPWKQAGLQSKAYLQVAPPGQGGAATGKVAGWYYFTFGGLVGSILPTSFNMRTKAGDAFQAEQETLTGLRPLEASLNGFPQAGNNLTGFMFLQYTDGTSTCLFNGNYVYTATLVAGTY
ncbi:MAG TPA: PKD domain-containing protein [Gemmatimonadales bacterium]|nr:PKD domain-containing protein [Gemmatimonadales bacterium]